MRIIDNEITLMVNDIDYDICETDGKIKVFQDDIYLFTCIGELTIKPDTDENFEKNETEIAQQILNYELERICNEL